MASPKSSSLLDTRVVYCGDNLEQLANFRDADTASLPCLESVRAVSAKLKTPNMADEKFSDVVKSAQEAAVLVLVY